MKRKVKTILLPGLLSIGGLLGLGQARAASPIVNTVPWGPETTAGTYPVNVPAFNTALGTLTSVTLGGNASSIADLRVINTGDTTDPFTNANVSVSITLQQSVGYPFAETTGAALSVTGLSGNATPGTHYFTGVGSVSNSVFTTQSIPSGEWSTFESVGPANLPIDVVMSNFTAGGTGSADLSYGAEGSTNGDIVVTYTYTPVPEPATMSLLVLGGSAVLLRRRRRHNVPA